jgi:hypothetical protein
LDLVGDPSGNGQQSDLGTLTQVILFLAARGRLLRAEFVNRQSAQTFSLGFVQFAQRTNVPETDKHKALAIARARAERRKDEKNYRKECRQSLTERRTVSRWAVSFQPIKGSVRSGLSLTL